MEFRRSLRRISFPATLLLPGLLNIQAENVMLPRPAPVQPVLKEAAFLSRVDGPSAKVLTEPMSSLYIRFNGFKTFMSNAYALNPTGGPVRTKGMDWWGSGEYHAPRYDPHIRRRYKH